MSIYDASYNDVIRAQRAFHDRERSEMIAADRARKIAKVGRCDGGCTLWRCGREAGHAGPCLPPEYGQDEA